MQKALIGITSGYAAPSENRDFCRTSDIVYADLNYARCIARAGGLPVLLPYADGDDLIGQMSAQLDGLLFSGGEDVHPSHYGQSVVVDNCTSSEIRDRFELSLVREFLKTRKPVLAVCRGIQLLNTAMGGTLIQDLPVQASQMHHAQKVPTAIPTHQVRFREDSRLFHIFGTAFLEINSHHHQAVDYVAPDLRVTGWSEEGVVEAVENRGRGYIIGVQWHPERLAETHSMHQLLFEDFVNKCETGHGGSDG
ncbi:gamma-glutamyl-gamma-aminobutyrate hydrolase family protein [candidate division KSB1 bacterium]|nr:MAG: gamma-glutamyl-gamma-aminobutyrate hydrolase family protein [candidate division KSB1 bacterium]